MANVNIFYLSILLKGYGITLLFMAGPLAFFYVRRMLVPDKKFNSSDLWHFAMFIIQFAAMIPCGLSTGLSVIPAGLNLALCILHLFIYTVLSYTIIFRYKKINLLKFINFRSYRLMVCWLVLFISIVTVILVYIIYRAFSLNDFIPPG